MNTTTTTTTTKATKCSIDFSDSDDSDDSILNFVSPLAFSKKQKVDKNSHDSSSTAVATNNNKNRTTKTKTTQNLGNQLQTISESDSMSKGEEEEHTNIINSNRRGVNNTNTRSPTKEKKSAIGNDDTSSGNVKNNKPSKDSIQKQAERKVKQAHINTKLLTKPLDLYWVKQKGKFYPARECQFDEIIYTPVIHEDDIIKSKAFVQFLEGCTFGLRDVVPRKTLTPYYGDDDGGGTTSGGGDNDTSGRKNRRKRKSQEISKLNDECTSTAATTTATTTIAAATTNNDDHTPTTTLKLSWCPKKLELLRKRQKKSRKKWTDADLLAEQLYLQRILELSREKEVAAAKAQAQAQQEEMEGGDNDVQDDIVVDKAARPIIEQGVEHVPRPLPCEDEAIIPSTPKQNDDDDDHPSSDDGGGNMNCAVVSQEIVPPKDFEFLCNNNNNNNNDNNNKEEEGETTCSIVNEGNEQGKRQRITRSSVRKTNLPTKEESQQQQQRDDDEKRNVSSSSSAFSSSSVSDLEDYITEPKRKYERIRADDVIVYYHPLSKFGDERGYRQATVLSVNSRKNPILELDNGEFLPKDTCVKRVKIRCRNKVIDYKEGRFQEITDYKLLTDSKKRSSTLKQSGDGTGEGSAVVEGREGGVVRESKRLGAIIKDKKRNLIEKVKESGGGDCTDLLHDCQKSR